VKLRVGRRAQEQADKIQAWWAANRLAAPSLFIDELEQTFHRICNEAGVGIRWPTPRRPGLRRILMHETKNHVYFVVDPVEQVVHVLAVWGAPRRRPPKL